MCHRKLSSTQNNPAHPKSLPWEEVRKGHTFRLLQQSASGHALTPSMKRSNITDSTYARARARMWLRHLFQASNAPIRRVCLLRRCANVNSNFPVRYLRVGRMLLRHTMMLSQPPGSIATCSIAAAASAAWTCPVVIPVPAAQQHCKSRRHCPFLQT